MYAQGATIATLLGAAVLTQTQRREAAEHKGVDHSWQTLVSILVLRVFMRFISNSDVLSSQLESQEAEEAAHSQQTLPASA